MIFTVVGFTALTGVALASDIPRCEVDESLGCRFLAELAKLQDDRIDQSVVAVNVAEFELLMQLTKSCNEGDSVADCHFWENWALNVFEHADLNNDGMISTHEKLKYTDGFEKDIHINREVSEQENLDGLPKGAISRADFVDKFKVEMLAEAFMAADVNGDFVVGLEEMEAIVNDNVAELYESHQAGDKALTATTGNSWLEQIDMDSVVPMLAVMPNAHLWHVLRSAVNGNQVVLGLNSQRRRLWWFFVCIWLCYMTIVAVSTIATGVATAGKCEYDEHTRMGQLERGLAHRCR